MVMDETDKPIDALLNDTSGNDTQEQDTDLNLRWQALPTIDELITEVGWMQQDLPAALQNLPEHITTSVQLQNLLSWSLYRNNAEDADNDLSRLVDANEPSRDINQPGESISEHGPEHREDAVSISAGTEGSARDSMKVVNKGKHLLSRLKQLQEEVGAKVAAKSQNLSRAKSTRRTEIVEESTQMGECISCFDEHPKSALVHLQCSHEYCKLCLREVVINAAKVESAFPPKCCLTEIPRKTALLCLDKSQRELYKEKAAEYAIPAGHRWYCPEPSCAKWIQPEKLHRDRRAEQTCPHCKHKFCSICRNVAHDQNTDCPEDFGLGSTLEVAESEGWRRCYSCRTMVELTTGCRHITCRCGAEFCYVCNARWQTCACTEADKDRRIRELQARKAERENRRQEDEQRQNEEDAAAQAEAEELAEAIAQIEEFERQEAIRLAEEARVRQLEEELALAKLEEERLLEEIARREAEEEAARQLREILLTSSREECEAMTVMLFQIIEYQHAVLMSEHETREATHVKSVDEHRASIVSESMKWDSWLQDNIQHRRERLQRRQEQERDTVIRQAEEEEDEMFMQMHMYLRDKPNREQREKKMRDAFQAQQKQKQDTMQQRHNQDTQKLESLVRWEMEGLQKATNSKVEAMDEKFSRLACELGHLVGCQRQIFQLVCRRRIEMLKEHTRLVYEQLEAEQEPTGLTEQQARRVEPILPALEAIRIEQSESILSHRVADSTGVISNQTNAVESEDLYAAPTPSVSQGLGSNSRLSVNKAGLVPAADDLLTRTNTIIQPIPGAYPTTSVKSQTTKSSDSRMPSSSVEYISAGSLGMYSSIPPYNNQPHLAQTTPRSHMPTANARTDYIAELPTSDLQSSMNDHRISNTSTASTVSTALTDTGSQSDARRASSRTSASAGSEVNIASTGTRSSIGELSNKPAKKGLFSKFAKKELTDEEIKRRMVAAVGDGFGR